MLTWSRIPAPSPSNASLSVFGGVIRPGSNSVSVAVSPEAVHDFDLIEIVFDFVENRNVGVRFQRSTWKMISDKHVHGDLEEVVKSLKGEQSTKVKVSSTTPSIARRTVLPEMFHFILILYFIL